MKIAIIHDWLITYAGSERVLEQMLICYPNADLFSLIDFLDPALKEKYFFGKKATTTFIQKLPFAKRKYRYYLPLMPLAIEQLDLSSYDLVISSSHAVAKGVITGPNQLHISYVHSPMRYAWDLQHQYLTQTGLDKGLKSWIAKYILHKMRIWDLRTANGVDKFICNSNFIAQRIKKTYRREAHIIYPPVDVENFTLREHKENFYLTAARMVPYKRIDLIVEAFSAMPDKKLIVIGDGPEMKRIREKMTSNITLLGAQSPQALSDYMQRAKAFVFAAEEDFGIVMAEAQACGTPVIAFGKGGAKEIVQDIGTSKPTGVLFYEQNVSSLRSAISNFESNSNKISPHDCRENAIKFASENFRYNFQNFIEKNWLEFIENKEKLS
jgi:glycosyltransferase involved in cell wall biosynthesis